MANIVNFSTYGFLNDILAMNEENWRKYFKPIVYDSVQTGLQVTAGADMTFNVSAGECRCGSIMGILNNSISLDVSIGDTNYNRIDSIVAQYVYDDPSTLSIAVLEGTPSISPVSPTLTKSYNVLWQIELAQILVPSNATTSSECTITDKRIIYNSLDSIIELINNNTTDIKNQKLLYFSSGGNNAMSVNVATNAEIGRIPASGTSSLITTDTVVLECVFANPSYITSNVSWTSYNGYVSFSGTCTAVTTANVLLGRKGN